MPASRALLDARRPFTRADALAAGITPKMLRGSRFRRIFRNVYVSSAVAETPLLRSAAALLPVHETAFASHASAARIHGVPIPTLPDEHVSVVRQEHRRPRPGVRFHVCPQPRVLLVDGVRVSDHAQMFVELASILNLVDLVVVGDNLVRHRRTSPAQLREFCAATSLPHAGRASAAAALVREDVDSPMETRLRLLLVLAGLPEPRINLAIRDADGTPLRRYDLSYPEARTIVEYDGRHHVERIAQWEADLERREEIDDSGWRILVVTSAGIHRRPDLTVQRVWRVLRARHAQGVPFRLADDWRPHFPVRP